MGKILEGQPLRYSNQQQNFLKLLIQNNDKLLEQEHLPAPPLPKSASWLFNPSTQPTINSSSSRMRVLTKDSKIVTNKKLACDMDDDKYEWKYNSAYDYLKNEEIKTYDKYTMITSNAMIRNFLAASIEGDIEYSYQNFIIRSTLGR